MVTAKCIGIDDKGKVKMSRKAAMKEKDDAAKAAAGGEGAAAPEAPAA
jgi:polyribonucleotide nucleotidyltransferase